MLVVFCYKNCTQICLLLPSPPLPVSSDILCLGSGSSSPSLLFDTTPSVEVTEGVGPATHLSSCPSLCLLLFSVWPKLKETLRVRALGGRLERTERFEVSDPQHPSLQMEGTSSHLESHTNHSGPLPTPFMLQLHSELHLVQPPRGTQSVHYGRALRHPPDPHL